MNKQFFLWEVGAIVRVEVHSLHGRLLLKSCKNATGAWMPWEVSERGKIWAGIELPLPLSGLFVKNSAIHRSKKVKKDGDMSILPECFAGIKDEYVEKDDKKQSYWIEISTQV